MAQIALAAVSAGMSIAQGVAAKGQADAQRAQYEQERKNALTAAASDEAARRGRLQSILATQAAMLAGRGLDPTDTQSQTIADASRSEAEADIGANKMKFLNQAERYSQAAALAKWQGKSAMTGAFINAGFQLLSGAGSQFGGSAGGLGSSASSGIGASASAVGGTGGFSAGSLGSL
jgi:hypothetical protein